MSARTKGKEYLLWFFNALKDRAWLRRRIAKHKEWLAEPMRPEPIAFKVDGEASDILDSYDEKIRALYEKRCRKVIADANKSLHEHRQSLAKSLANPVRIWNFKAWVERRFSDDLDRWRINYEEARIRKAMHALSEKELSKT